jgi:hypothetical protein
MIFLACPIVNLTRLHGSVHATARVLAPSKEAFDTPLSPPPLNDEPGPATSRVQDLRAYATWCGKARVTAAVRLETCSLW